jgi:hypothetical protein
MAGEGNLLEVQTHRDLGGIARVVEGHAAQGTS